MCINREELNDALSLGLGRETGLTPAEYDPERANELLDEMGMDQRNAEGFRLSPDGEPFSIPIDAANLWGWEGSGAELMVEYLREVGIDARAKVVEFGMWASLGQSNEIKSSVHWANMPQWFLNPVGRTEYLPDQFRSWGPAWRSWYDSEGESGKEPPEKVKRLFELRQTILRSVSEEDRRRAVEEIIDSYQENIWMIGLVYPPRPTLLNADFGNAPVGKNVEFQIYYWKYVEQYFYK
jgi:peptide/nickel transport system substrate-binding protein